MARIENVMGYRADRGFRQGAMALLFASAFTILNSTNGFSQTGSVHEPVRYVGGTAIDPNVHEGRLRYAVGVENRQTFRANRTNPELAEGYGWTYNHASSLTYWNNTFYQQYLSNQVDEHVMPGQTLLVTSKDGRNWSKPEVVFPPYVAPKRVKIPKGYDGYMMHQRMGFYAAPNGKLLTVAFYAHTHNPFGKGGIGRVVREVKKDGTYGPIYFVRYSSHTQWNESNTSYPLYNRSDDREFVAACDSLLADKLLTLLWRDEDEGLDGFYDQSGPRGGSAFSYYHRKDGKLVGLWKRSLAALSDNDKTFSKSVEAPTLIMSGGKVWGQKTKDSRYALVYNPIELTQYRYPLTVVSGDDGVTFDNMLLVQGEVPPRRFFGRAKDFGPCYVRGLEEGNGETPGSDMWLTYSMNKEDLWVSRVPVPIQYRVVGPVADHFDLLKEGGPVPDWNIYAPRWAPVDVVKAPGKTGNALLLKDQDPEDYARAIRVFEETKVATLSMDVMAGEDNHGLLDIDVTDEFGNRPVRIRFDENGKVLVTEGVTEKPVFDYQKGKSYELKLVVNAGLSGSFDVFMDGKVVAKQVVLAEAVKSVERLSLRTGLYRNFPKRTTPNQERVDPLAGCDDMVPPTVFYVDNVKINSGQ